MRVTRQGAETYLIQGRLFQAVWEQKELLATDGSADRYYRCDCFSYGDGGGDYWIVRKLIPDGCGDNYEPPLMLENDGTLSELPWIIRCQNVHHRRVVETTLNRCLYFTPWVAFISEQKSSYSAKISWPLQRSVDEALRESVPQYLQLDSEEIPF